MYKSFIVLALVVFAAVAFAQGPVGKDTDKRQVDGFMPSAFGVLEATKADMTLSTATVHAVRIQPSVAVTVKVNGTGTAWPIAANTVQEYRIPANVTSLVFSAASSASNKVYYQTQ
jgi:hypothetical protein